MHKKVIVLISLFLSCTQNPIPILNKTPMPVGNWKACAFSLISNQDTTSWQDIVVNCDSVSYTEPNSYNIIVKNDSLIQYTCSTSVNCNAGWEITVLENYHYVSLKSPNGLGGYKYELWCWQLFQDTLSISIVDCAPSVEMIL
jgi:hypothetical protein